MDRAYFYAMMHGDGSFDYEKYLNTPALFKCQKPFDALCNGDELQFQIVHQIEELWMKLIGYTLLDIDEHVAARRTHRVVTLFHRVRILQRLLIEQLQLLETMSPKEYQAIRLQLGNGSGQESPGFRTLLKMAPLLWDSYKKYYLDAEGLSVDDVYDLKYDHGPAYVVAERLVEFDELFQTFRFHHLQLIRRSIGADAKSLKGRPVELLEAGVRHAFYPELWAVRGRMTDKWGATYGVKRDSIPGEPGGGFH
ncbi:MAG: tryptophan 2,3-dioxygenase family protein [Amphiplicatus sp.]|jgi:tryptophan 2,3-dioxygenase